MTLPIVRFNSPILRKKGVKITVFDTALARLAEDMIDTMHDAAGIGLAAQQVDHAIQLCVVDLRQTESEFQWEYDGARPPLEIFMPLVLVNPIVVTLPEPTTSYEQGCLSFPEIRGDVIRPDKLTVNFKDLQGVSHILVCNGLLSRCVQHEADHLNGILFIERMDTATLAALDPELKVLKKLTREAAKK